MKYVRGPGQASYFIGATLRSAESEEVTKRMIENLVRQDESEEVTKRMIENLVRQEGVRRYTEFTKGLSNVYTLAAVNFVYYSV